MFIPMCLCGETMEFSNGQGSTRCPKCHAQWRRDRSGFWAKRSGRILFTPKDKWLAKRKGGAGKSEKMGVLHSPPDTGSASIVPGTDLGPRATHDIAAGAGPCEAEY